MHCTPMEALGHLLLNPSRKRTTASPRHSCLIKLASRTTSVTHILGGVLAVLDGAIIDHHLVRVVEKIHVAMQQRRVSPRQHLRENLSGLRIRNQYLTCNLPHRETISWMPSNLTNVRLKEVVQPFWGKRRSIAFKHTARSTDSTSLYDKTHP